MTPARRLELAALANRIEMYLLARGNVYVPIPEICEECEIEERLLRADGRRRPLCRNFAISSTKNGQNGLKHLFFTTPRERIRFKHAKLKNLIAYARALNDFKAAVRNSLTGSRPLQTERFTGQGILL